MESIDAPAWIAAIITTLSLIFVGIQIMDARKVARGEFLFQIDERLQSHFNAHLLIMKDEEYKWDDKQKDAEVYSYIGFFERIHVIYKMNIISISEIHSF